MMGSHVKGQAGEGVPRRVLSHLTDDNPEHTLARPVPRRDPLMKLTSVWSSTDEGTNELMGTRTELREFCSRVLEGLHTRLPERSSYVLNSRMYGSMRDGRGQADEDVVDLPRCAGAVRLRQEHMEVMGGSRRMPRRWEMVSVDCRQSVMGIAYNALVGELEDLERMVQSMELRKYDIGTGDVEALFAWMKTTENFVRRYLVAGERVVYEWARAERWGDGSWIWRENSRRKAKLRIVQAMEAVEGMRRAMMARGSGCGEMLGELRKRVDVVMERGTRVLGEEARTVEVVVQGRLSRAEMEEVLTRMVRELRKGEYGREMVLVLSRGVSAGKTERELWVKERSKGLSRVVVQLWTRRLEDRHSRYVDLFEAAEKEYVRLYDSLGRELDGRDEGGGGRRGRG